MTADCKTQTTGDVTSHGLLCFGVPCDLQAWLNSPERVMRHVRDGMSARKIHYRIYGGTAVDFCMTVEDLKSCVRHGLLRCEKGKWFIQHNAALTENKPQAPQKQPANKLAETLNAQENSI